MTKLSITTIGILWVVIAGGCHNAKSPDAVASNVASAQNKAETKIADARADAANSSESAQAKVDETTEKLNVTSAKGVYEVAIAKADGDQKVAIEKCNALGGDAQKACKDQADAKHDLDVANAKATLATRTP